MAPYPPIVLKNGLKSQDGCRWKGNSSFDNKYLGKPQRQDLLDEKIKSFIETICGPEMRWLGYSVPNHNVSGTIEKFQDPFQVGTPSLSDVDKADELERLEIIKNRLSFSEGSNEPACWFIFEKALQELQTI